MLACDRAPEGGHGIPSQPTLSRLENVPDPRTLYRIGIGYIDFFCDSYATPPETIVLDIDDADDLVHGCQQLALFNTHAGGRCLQPIRILEGNSGKPILSLLRPGKRPKGEEVARVLWHVTHPGARHEANTPKLSLSCDRDCGDRPYPSRLYPVRKVLHPSQRFLRSRH